VKWTRPRTLTTIDPRVMINPAQARRFFAAVEAHSKRGQRMRAFFGCLYYAALRPEEASDLRRENLVSRSYSARVGPLLRTREIAR
jgi:integrase